ncbi:putative Protein kinase domain [Trypanosoma grayi]|uniref:putative Protein kinase domain n=1 Tax=Trypanosoma grayi TaxID=71804 RepID=UPI0004F477BE|nr:putative Protein kinase domain [Trypanosoma grayi]KEG09764.1 putative Protein kinase domain [Trypanosoma grayi]
MQFSVYSSTSAGVWSAKRPVATFIGHPFWLWIEGGKACLMIDAVVLEYNPDTEEAVVEAVDAPSRRYRVSMPSQKGPQTCTNTESHSDTDKQQKQQQQQGSTGRRRLKYVDHLLNSRPVGRCVTVEPVHEETGDALLPLARLVHLHEAESLTSKSMLPGTITRVASRFVFIFCSFLPYEVVATREMFSTGGFLTNTTCVPPVTSSEATAKPGGEVKEEQQWVGLSVYFALHPMSFLVMEAFFAPSESSVYPAMKEQQHINSTRGGGSMCPYWRGYSRVALDDQRDPVVAHTGSVAAEGCPSDRLGTWHIIGKDPSHFFQPELSVQFVHCNELLPCNTVPPVLYQRSTFTVQLWCFWMLDGTHVSLRALDEDRHDVTESVLHIEKIENKDVATVTLDNLENREVVSFQVTIKNFKMQDVVCELTFMLHAECEGLETHLESKSVFVRRSTKGLTTVNKYATSKPTQKRDVLSRKFWTSDVLSPEDKIVGGFTDPGRSNQLLAEDCYEEMPMAEREIIVVDPEDTRLQAIAAAARRAVLGIIDTVVRVQALMWLVVSAYGGENLGESAEDYIASLRRQRGTKKRQRGGAQSNNGANVVRLGEVRRGVCRHRALLFKYLCDAVQLPCYLLRGEHQGPDDTVAERHSWNIVPLEGRRHLLVDTTLSPHKLEMWPVDAYKAPAFALLADWGKAHCIILHRAAERIHMLEECGRGATAVVRRGVLGGGLTCVVKVPRRNSDMDSLVREYEVLRKFRGSTHVVRCLGWSGGIVMEYFPTNLLSFMNHLIIREKRMSLSQQREVLLGVLAALKDVHTQGYVHRDIKAENVLVVVIRCSTCHSLGTVCHLCDVRAKLGDFADAVAVNPTTQLHKATPRVGTPPYTAPELEAELPFSFAADIWSCGILAVEMALMQLPEACAPPCSVQLGRARSDKREGSGDDDDDDDDDDNDGSGDKVAVMVDGKRVGPVRVPKLPCNPPPPKWQLDLVVAALQVNWRQRSTARLLHETLKNTFC